jgi:hypothetical protein
MHRNILRGLAVAVAMSPLVTFTQSGPMKPTAATYITAEEVATVHALPGVDRTIKVVDIGGEHFSVGTIHRGATVPPGGAARGAAPVGGAGRAATGTAAGRGATTPPGRAGAASPEPCGERSSTPPPAGTVSGISHDSQTEGYLITSGGGTMITGGHIVNGRKSAPDAEVTTTLNGPSCSGAIVGNDVVRRVVKTGDIVIIPAGVPHGWTGITDHVDYLSFRPSGQTLSIGYVNPAIKK